MNRNSSISRFTGFLASICLLMIVPSAAAAEFKSSWEGSRPWVGPVYWGSPLYDWKTQDGVVEAVLAPNRLLHLLTHRADHSGSGLRLETSVELLSYGRRGKAAQLWAGFAVGVKGLMDDTRHVAVGPTRQIAAGVRVDGRLRLGGKVSDDSLPGTGPVELVLVATGDSLELKATREGKTVAIHQETTPDALAGNVCLATGGPVIPEWVGVKEVPTARFGKWMISGESLIDSGVKPFGPILWTQYTRQGKRVKLSVQMPPLGWDDSKQVRLEIRNVDGAWLDIGHAAIDPMSRTALCSFKLPSARGDFDYRVTYPWQGKDSEWSGKLIEDPAVAGKPLKIGVFSCDHGYAFPLPTLVRNVMIQDPNLMFFAGDQIYENYGGFKVIRKPVDTAMLDYLRKWYQFGWTWRELLKDRPSIILPDDHDVFQGNLWGAGGRPIKVAENGGYVMPAEWVKAVEQTQTGHLPDPVDPEPIEQGIGVYFTDLIWGGVPMAILEDRKWKSGPNAVLPKIRKDLTAKETDVPGADLLGARQEQFLQQRSKQTAKEPLRLVFSQTIFCKGHTHSGPDLKRNHFDWDSNGWPRSGRDRALRPLMGDNTVMLHGDQHLGLFVRQGVETWNDGPWAFMVPGTSNGWPRAWWPEDGRITGDFTDPFGNKFTVLAAANPEKGSNTLNPRKSDPPEKTAQEKGSGYGMIEIAPDRRSARFEMWRYAFDAKNPKPQDQFNGFPQTLEFGKGE